MSCMADWLGKISDMNSTHLGVVILTRKSVASFHPQNDTPEQNLFGEQYNQVTQPIQN